MDKTLDQQIIPGAEPFFFRGGEIGCLLVHGFTGSPKEMLMLGEFLVECGYSELAPRLVGHATNIEDMARSTWKDWMLAVEEGWHLLSGSTKKIFVAGLSMDGALALLQASKFPAAGVIAMSTPYQLKADPRLRIIKLMQYIFPTISKGEPDWVDPSLEADHISYERYPTGSIIELNKLLAEMRRCLAQVKSPTLLIHSSNDKGVDPENMQLIYDQLGSPDKAMRWIENSGHVIIRDRDHPKVFSFIREFIERISSGP